MVLSFAITLHHMASLPSHVQKVPPWGHQQTLMVMRLKGGTQSSKLQSSPPHKAKWPSGCHTGPNTLDRGPTLWAPWGPCAGSLRCCGAVCGVLCTTRPAPLNVQLGHDMGGSSPIMWGYLKSLWGTTCYTFAVLRKDLRNTAKEIKTCHNS